MGRRTWFKVYSEKWMRGTIRAESAVVRAVFVDLLAMNADSPFGDDGIIQVAKGVGYTDDGISSILNVTKEEWEVSKNRLSNHPDSNENRIELIPSGHGFAIKILNWERYQSEYDRQKGYRNKSYYKKLQQKLQPKLQPKLHKRLLEEGEGEGEGEVETTTTTSTTFLPQDKNLAPAVSIWPDKDKDFLAVIEKAEIDFPTKFTYLKDWKWWDEVGTALSGLEPEFLKRQFSKMKVWLMENPSRCPTEKGLRRFVRTWLEKSKEQRRIEHGYAKREFTGTR